jgi:hypothetical protein
MAQEFDTIGIIAGNRSLPLVFARQAKALGVKRLVAVAFENETDPELAGLVDEIVWLKVGQLAKMISALKERGVACCVMLGQIAPRNLFDLRPDFRAVTLLLKLKEKNAQSLFGAVADELKKDGIEFGDRVLFGTGVEREARGRCGVGIAHRQGGFPAGDWADGGDQGGHSAGGGRL